VNKETSTAQALKNVRSIKGIIDLLKKYDLNDEYEALVKRVSNDPSQKEILEALTDLKKALYSVKLSTLEKRDQLIEKIDLYVLSQKSAA